jgi:acyl-CoA reductase-like NAD-dependent aldehyde dehydrogenase
MQHLLQAYNYFNGAFQQVDSAQNLSVHDKYSGNLVAEIPILNEHQAEEVVDSAVRGFEIWSLSSAAERSRILNFVAQKLDAESDAFAELIVCEAGKPVQFARNEVQRAIQTLKIAAQEALRMGGEIVPMDFGNGIGKIAQTRHFATGPVLGFSPFNFPLNLAMHKIAPALAVGCSIVMKAPPQAPLSLLALCRLFQEAGLPHGVLNAVIADDTIAAALVRDERFSVFSFTGSDAVGWYLKSIAGKKKVMLELGGNAGVFVDESANFNDAARQIARSAYMYSGQVCIATQRIFVHASVETNFKTALIKEIDLLKNGNPAIEETINGPLINKKAFERCASWTEEATTAGATVLAGGKAYDETHCIWEPTLLSDVNETMRVFSDEVFAPIAILEVVDHFDRGIDRLNASRFGLQNAVFTTNIEHVKRAFSEVKSGSVLINIAPGFRLDHMPYGGIKDSGEGLEGVRYAMEMYTNERLLIW